MKWEYKTVIINIAGFFRNKVSPDQIEDCCNQLGKEGWELVTNSAHAVNYGETKNFILIFKRPLE